MNIQDYPVTELYGCQPGYPLNQNLCPPGQGFHNGIDYGCPSGTPIVVNGVTIGISGATGAVTGPHVHVGRWVNGKSTDPGVGNGFKFDSAVVTEINQDSVNGKYVRVQADGASWVYLHMSDNNKVSVGQVLQSEGEEAMITDDITKYCYGAWLGREPNQNELDSWRGRDTNTLIVTLVQSNEAHDRYNKVKAAFDGGVTATTLKPGVYKVN